MVDFKWTWHLDGGWWQGIRVHSEFLNTVGVLGHAGVVYRVYDMRYIYNVYPHQSPSAPYVCSLSFSLFHLFPPIPSRETYPHRHHHLHPSKISLPIPLLKPSSSTSSSTPWFSPMPIQKRIRSSTHSISSNLSSHLEKYALTSGIKMNLHSFFYSHIIHKPMEFSDVISTNSRDPPCHPPQETRWSGRGSHGEGRVHRDHYLWWGGFPGSTWDPSGAAAD